MWVTAELQVAVILTKTVSVNIGEYPGYLWQRS